MDPECITVEEYEKILKSGTSHLLIDVRSPNNRHLAPLSNAVSVPIETIVSGDGCEKIVKFLSNIECCPDKNTKMIFAMCECGETSPDAVRELRSKLKNCTNDILEIKYIIGGVEKYAEDIDPDLFVN